MNVINENTENIIKLLINRNSFINERDKDGRSALTFALINIYSENIIKLLINKNTDLNKKDKLSRSPLML